MTQAELVEWFRDLSKRATSIPRDEDGYYREREAAKWLAEAESALSYVFPPAHPIRTKWREIFVEVDRQKTFVRHHLALEPAAGVFGAAREILEAGRLASVFDGVRLETLTEVLDQAAALLPESHVAAAVLAGGALETHLLHLCQRHGLVPAGEGSISKYDAAIAQARNTGNVVVYPATDTKLIAGWGGIRNDAAHRPTTFPYKADDVRLMIEGVRQFTARVP